MKHNISITMDQKLFRELENIRGREKRSTFIEHLIVLGLKDFANKNEKKAVKAAGTATLLPQYNSSRREA
jgi:metal-responsive CopG/Arc/MetJ family transcriptional regulator